MPQKPLQFLNIYLQSYAHYDDAPPEIKKS